MLSSISSTLAGPKFVETDDVRPFHRLMSYVRVDGTRVVQWFNNQKILLDRLETQLRGLIKAIDFVARQRSGTRLSTSLSTPLPLFSLKT